MTVTSTPATQRQQNTRPTSMRYGRIQDILGSDPLLKTKLGPKNHHVDSRIGESLQFSKEVVEVTEAIHADGRDAYKLPKHEVLRVALRVMNVMPASSLDDGALSVNPLAQLAGLVPAATEVETISEPVLPAETQVSTGLIDTVAQAPVDKTKKPQAPVQIAKSHPVPVEVKIAKPVQISRRAAKSSEEAARSAGRNGEVAVDAVPESELPPERQPLHLPVAFDPSKWPHYNVQSSIYSMLLSALNLSEHFERFPGFEERQQRLELVIKSYLITCDAIRD